MTPAEKIDNLIELHGLNNNSNQLQFEKLHDPNNWAAHGTTLKDYCNIPIERSLHFAITHGQTQPLLYNHLSQAEFRTKLPLLAINSSYSIPMAEEECNCLAFSIGSINAYADVLFDQSKCDTIKASNGRSLLVFIQHTTPTSNYTANYNDLFKDIDCVSNEFDSITFCLYWVDLLKRNDWVKQIAGYGNIICNGHTLSRDFQRHIRTNIELSDVIMINDRSSAMTYAANAKKRIWIHPVSLTNYTTSQIEQFDIDSANERQEPELFNYFVKVHNLNAFPKAAPNVLYTDIVSGCDKLLTANELKSIDVLGQELLGLGFQSCPGIKSRLRTLCSQNSPLSENSRHVLAFLFEKSDLAYEKRDELKLLYSEYFNSFNNSKKQKSRLTSYLKRDILCNPIKIDICCGESKPTGFIGVDRYPGKDIDIIHDLNENFPFNNSIAEYVRAHDAIQHLREPLKTMNEIWRICKNGAIVDIKVPSTDGRGAFQDPTHVSFWNENSFMYYTIDHPDYLTHGKNYGFKGAFKLLELQNVNCGMNVIQLYVKLQAIKPVN